jgi:chromosome partitioning protein
VRTIAIINQKGGCGKTTSAINLSGLLAKSGVRTLLVDMDPQSHCAAGLGVPENRIDMDIGDAMLAAGNKPLDGQRLFWRAGRNLDLAPSRMRLAGLEARRGGLSELADKDRRLGRVLAEFRNDYDAAIIDCSPAIGLLTFNALTAAGVVIIPVETSFFSLQGATRQFNTVKTMARRLGVSVPVWVLPTIHDETSEVASDLLVELRRRFKDRMIPIVIRRDPKLKEAASFGQTIHDYAPSSIGAEDYTHLANWVAQMLQTVPQMSATGAAASTISTDASEMIDPALVEVLPGSEDQPRENTQAEQDADAFAGRPMSFTPAATSTQTETGVESRAVNRAEDVARRAQQFLRRIATAPATATSSPSAEFTSEAAFSEQTSTLQLESPPSSPPQPVSNIAQNLLGVRITSQGVLFVQPLTRGDQICIAGEFNNWSPTSHPMRKNRTLGVFELCIPLPYGKTRYRLVVDGVWSPDTHNHAAEENPFGEPNNFVTVPGEANRATQARVTA